MYTCGVRQPLLAVIALGNGVQLLGHILSAIATGHATKGGAPVEYKWSRIVVCLRL